MNDLYLDPEKKFYNYRTGPINGSDIFDINVASNSWAGNFIDDPTYMLKNENMVMHIEDMSPKEYWQTCARDVFHKPMETLLHQWRTLDAKTIEHLKEVILKYKRKFPITYIDYAHHDGAKQEGLHRMIVAGDLFGWDTKFPVMIIEWADKNLAEKEKIAKHKAEVERYIDKAVKKALRYNYYNIDELEIQLKDELEDALEYLDEFDNNINISLSKAAGDEIFILTLNDTYTYEISIGDINMIAKSDTDFDDLDDLILDGDIDSWLADYLD